MNLKYSMGLDIAKDDIKACLCVINDTQDVSVISSNVFENTKTGVTKMASWFTKNCVDKSIPQVIIMEPTGVYYEVCAYQLHRMGFKVSVVLATSVKNYLKSLGHKTKNDIVDAKGIATMGAQRNLDQWQPMSENMMQIRTLTRHHQAVQERITASNNQLHAEKCGEVKNKMVIDHLQESIKFDKEQVKLTAKEIHNLVKEDPELHRKFKIVAKIVGIGLLTAVTVVTEFGGFETFSNYKQVVSYAGYDVVENQSGKHTGKTKISKKGNSRVRRALYMPALSAVSHDKNDLKNLFERVYLRNPKYKMIGYVAVQKKLLIYIYYAWSKEVDYSLAKIPKEEQVTTSPLGCIASFESEKVINIEKINEDKNSHQKLVATQGRYSVSDYSLTPHR